MRHWHRDDGVDVPETSGSYSEEVWYSPVGQTVGPTNGGGTAGSEKVATTWTAPAAKGGGIAK